MPLHPIGYLFIIVVVAYMVSLVSIVRNARRGFILLRASSVLLLVSWAIYVSRFVMLDYSLGEVYWNTSPSLPLWLRIGCSWASSGGSIILFSMVLAVALLYLARNPSRSETRKAAILLSVIIVLSLVIAFSGNTFLQLENPTPAGAGLNPLLKSPWLYPHPLSTFIGYALIVAGSVMQVFGFDPRGYKLIVLGWSALTVGIMLGGYWSYETFGWGGYWAWDPVETSELMVWLTVTSYLHLRRMLPSLARGLIHLTLSSVFLAMFVTRTGLSPLHSFGAPTMGSYILAFLNMLWLIGFLYVVARTWQNTIHEAKSLFKNYTHYTIGLALAGASILIAGFFVYASLFIPSLMVAAGKEVSVPQLSAGASYYNPPLYAIVLVFLSSLLLVFLGDRIGWKGFAALVSSLGSITATIVLATYVGALKIAPLSGWETNAMMAAGLLWSSSALASIVIYMMLGLFKRRINPRMLFLSLIHLGVVITLIGVFLSGTFSFSDVYSWEYNLRPGSPIVLPGGVTLELKSYEYSISRSLVDVYTEYVGKSPVYFAAWNAINLLDNDLGFLLRSIRLGKLAIEKNETLAKLFAMAGKHLELESYSVTIDNRSISITCYDIARNYTEKTLIPKTRIKLRNANFTISITPTQGSHGAPASLVEAVIEASKLVISLNASSITCSNPYHSYFEISLSSPITMALPGGVIVKTSKLTIIPGFLEGRKSSTEVINGILSITNASMYIDGVVELNGTQIVLPFRTDPQVALYYMYKQANSPLLRKIEESELYDLLVSRKLLTLVEDSRCKHSTGGCVGYVKAPKLIPETAFLKLLIEVCQYGFACKDVGATIRFEAYGEIQGVHGLVSKIIHLQQGLNDIYIVVHPPTVSSQFGSAAYHELLIYYLSTMFKQFRSPEDRLALVALMASGYNLDLLKRLPDAQRASLLERAVVDLYILADNFDPRNSTIIYEGIPVEVKIIPGTILVWIGPIIMSLAAIIMVITGFTINRTKGVHIAY